MPTVEDTSGVGNRGALRRPISVGLDLPGGRAVVGGLLIALSVTLLVIGSRGLNDDHRESYLVLTRDIPAGTTIASSDLALAPMDLYAGTAEAVLNNETEAIGSVALVPMQSGTLVARESIGAGAEPPGSGRSVGLRLSPAQALNGALSIGDRVDVVGLVETADQAAAVLMNNAVVMSVSSAGGESLGSSDSVDVTLAVSNAEEATRLVGANARDGVTLIRASGIGGNT